MTFGETYATDTRVMTNRTPSGLPKSRADNHSSTRSLVELSERQDGNENGSERLSTRTESFHADFGAKTHDAEILGSHTTLQTGPSVGIADGTDHHGIYMTKSVEMSNNKLE